MASKKQGTRVPGQRTAPDHAKAVSLARQLITLAGDQMRQAQSNLELARVGLSELEIDLTTRDKGGAQ